MEIYGIAAFWGMAQSMVSHQQATNKALKSMSLFWPEIIEWE
jgi:hypothetical protein